jgi:hypothetical protein
VDVIDGVMEGIEVGGNSVFVGMIMAVATTAGVSVAGIVPQDTRITGTRNLRIGFIIIFVATEP